MIKKTLSFFVILGFLTACFSFPAAAAELFSFEVEVVDGWTYRPEPKPYKPSEWSQQYGGSTDSEYAPFPKKVDTAAFADEIFQLLNDQREKAGVARLWRSSEMDEVATVRANELIVLNAHTRPSGEAFSSAVSEYGLPYTYVGENIGTVPSNYANSFIVSAWMSSDGHRANILHDKYTDIGIGVVHKGNTIYYVMIPFA